MKKYTVVSIVSTIFIIASLYYYYLDAKKKNILLFINGDFIYFKELVFTIITILPGFILVVCFLNNKVNTVIIKAFIICYLLLVWIIFLQLDKYGVI